LMPIWYDNLTSSKAALHSPVDDLPSLPAGVLFPSTKCANRIKLRYCFRTLARCIKSASDGIDSLPSIGRCLRRVLRFGCWAIVVVVLSSVDDEKDSITDWFSRRADDATRETLDGIAAYAYILFILNIAAAYLSVITLILSRAI